MTLGSLRTLLPVGIGLGLVSAASAQQFTQTTIPGTTIWTDGVEIADIDNDGDNDILFANGSTYGAGGFQPQHLFLNDGAGNFSAAHGQLNVANFNAKMVIAEDFDNDGDLDLMYAPEGAFPATTQLPRMLINDGTGNFTDQSAARIPALTMASFCVCAGDVDDDGDLDVVFTDGATFFGVATQARLYLNDGNGFFTSATGTNMPVDTYNAQDVTLFDWEGDYDLDIALSGKGAAGKRSRLYLNDGTGNFTISSALDTLGGSGTYEIDWADLDGDGDLDGLVQSISGNNEGVARNLITEVGKITLPNPNGGDDNEMAGLDYDNDGDIDVLVGSLAGSGEKLYRNDGAFSFVNVNASIQTITDSTLDLGIGDLNGDGDYDIVTGQGESGNFTNRIYTNSGPADTIAPTVLGTEDPSYGVTETVFHARTQDAIADDGGNGFVTATFQAWQGSTTGVAADSGTAFHQGGGSWRVEVPTLTGATGAQFCWTFTDANGNTSTSSVTSGTVADWTDLGQGLAGTPGIPTLTGTGAVVPGGALAIDLTGCEPGAPGAIAASVVPSYLPFFGGTLVPDITSAFVVPFVADGSGNIPTQNFNWPSTLPACTVMYTQAGCLDGGASGGIALSNALATLQK